MKKYIFSIAVIALSAMTALPAGAAQPCKVKVIAHRGYWKAEGSAQNSIASLQNAARIGCWGSEFDVNVTKDGVPVVNHDAHIGGVRFDQNDYSAFDSIMLPNGEKLPTLKEYLEEGRKHPKIKLILEMKTASTPEFETKAVKAIMDMVDSMKMTKQVEYISFSLHMVKETLKRNPKATVAYLNGDLAPAELKAQGIPGMDYRLKKMLAQPEWFAEGKRNGLYINVWTVNKADDMRKIIALGANFITTDEPEMLQEVITDIKKAM